MRTILFVCYGNAFRSQMAEGFFNYLNKNPESNAISAGTNPFGRVPETTVSLMKEKNIDITKHTSKLLTKKMIDDAYRIYILCEDNCPVTPKEKTVKMFVEDPIGQSIESMRAIRNEIEEKIKEILKKLST